jgi:O-antigen ligase
MIGLLTSAAALLYCFVWLRPPEIGGVALPVQRILGWAAIVLLFGRLLLKGPLAAGPAARKFLSWAASFLIFLLLLLVRQLAYGEDFIPLYFLMDLSKYAAAFAVAYLCYYALISGLVSQRRLIHRIILSGALATGVVFGLTVLYFAGFRTDIHILAPSFGGALGVWPVGGVLPRLAGPTAEPQQLSVVLLTPLLLMLSPQYVRRTWPIALATATALLLSQSKFAVISAFIAGVYLFMVYRRWRWALVLGGMLAAPALAITLLRLPTFAITLQEGLSANSFVERLQNVLLLLRIIREHPIFGIGPGHYGVFWGRTLYGDPHYFPGYTPNMDFLKVFAETGIVGFALLLLLLGFLSRLCLRAFHSIPIADRSIYLAALLGALAILLNMAIGYELLHAFFWINVGLLLFMADRHRQDGSADGDSWSKANQELSPATPS